MYKHHDRVSRDMHTHMLQFMCHPHGGSTATQPVGVAVGVSLCVTDDVGWPQSISMMFCGMSAN